MIIRDALKTQIPRLDAEVLLAYVLGVSRSWIIAHIDEPISAEESSKWLAAEARRLMGEPVAYITNEKEFFGRKFFVTSDVLVPRPSTESLVQGALDFLKHPVTREDEVDTGISIFSAILRKRPPCILLDVGTGSGVVAITLALERKKEKVIAVDSSASALAIAKKNAEDLKAAHMMEFACVDGIVHVASIREPFLLISNPPYIPLGSPVERDVAVFEPKQALFAGADGMEVIRPLLTAAKKNPACVGCVLEMRTDQVEHAAALI